MSSKRFTWVAMLALASFTGCAMCDNSEDCTYPAFGGKWQRDNPFSGRVGSLFDPGGIRVTDQVAATEAGPPLAESEAAEVEAAENAAGPQPAAELEIPAGAAPSEGPAHTKDLAPNEGTKPAESAKSTEGPASIEGLGPAKGPAPAVIAKPAEGPTVMPKSTLAKPLDVTPSAKDALETMPGTAAKEESSEGAKTAVDQAAPNSGLQLPALPGEKPEAAETAEPKDGGTNLLPPLELPPQP